ncbi:M15 family metallopeptidase [Pseudoxanthomonas wuyuanensis]|uniref:D-alanyl-D-alanine dipeptidase n=1 Tax=Pseudoxanthomonas wuyuanensis TaxID=1073196 RepID=A0A286D9S3_9GAMM|nr:D-Ala-D-Ala dipeptidase vanX. Metallo peptidase. MEROPS family M15D [Pseudoxanthomonas wuyuanensis]
MNDRLRSSRRVSGPVFAALCWLAATACAAPPVQLSPAQSVQETDLVDVATLVPDAQLDIRYAGTGNFTGDVVDGYLAPKCYLLRPVAEALVRVADDLRAEGLSLQVFDCYRPARAVRRFVAWSKDLDDQRTKPDYYPNLDKSQLLDGYIAETSGHSRGATIDLSLTRCADGTCQPLDMGTRFDFFDTLANTADPRITAEQKYNRQRLLKAMARHGFRNYPMEWWHYTLQPEPAPGIAYDIPVQ